MVKAWILILSTPGSEPEIIEKLKEIDSVKEAYVVYGEWDIITKVETKSLKELDEVLLKLRKEVPGIIRTMTLISIDE